jgi:ferredoxin
MSQSEQQASQDKLKINSKAITVSVADKDIIYLDSHNNLLECIESADIEVHYHCRDGYCGACRVTLTRGQISYPQGEPLAYVGDNEILPCCCIPMSNIELKVE